jgi:hypothetical protein
MALKQAKQIVQKLPAISAGGYEPIAIVGDYVTVAGLAADDVIEMCILPAGYVPIDAILVTDDLDSNGAPTVTLDCGVLSGTGGVADDARTCGNEAFAASTVGQAGGLARPTKADFGQITPTTGDRGIGLKLAAGAATLVVGADIRLTVIARPALNDV